MGVARFCARRLSMEPWTPSTLSCIARHSRISTARTSLSIAMTAARNCSKLAVVAVHRRSSGVGMAFRTLFATESSAPSRDARVHTSCIQYSCIGIRLVPSALYVPNSRGSSVCCSTCSSASSGESLVENANRVWNAAFRCTHVSFSPAWRLSNHRDAVLLLVKDSSSVVIRTSSSVMRLRVSDRDISLNHWMGSTNWSSPLKGSGQSAAMKDGGDGALAMAGGAGAGGNCTVEVVGMGFVN